MGARCLSQLACTTGCFCSARLKKNRIVTRQRRGGCLRAHQHQKQSTGSSAGPLIAFPSWRARLELRSGHVGAHSSTQNFICACGIAPPAESFPTTREGTGLSQLQLWAQSTAESFPYNQGGNRAYPIAIEGTGHCQELPLQQGRAQGLPHNWREHRALPRASSTTREGTGSLPSARHCASQGLSGVWTLHLLNGP